MYRSCTVNSCLCPQVKTSIATEWSQLKALVSLDHNMKKPGGLHQLKNHDLWGRLMTTLNSKFVHLSFFIGICLKVPLDTSCCERWFSLMNRLKSKYRNIMSQSLLRDLMFICANGPKLLKDLHVPLAICN